MLMIRYKTSFMRQRFEQQMNLRTVAISDVKFPLKSRDELPPVLMALKYISLRLNSMRKSLHCLKKRYAAAKRKQAEKAWICGIYSCWP